MSDEPLSKPLRVPVTAEWLAGQERKQAAYVKARRRYRAAFLRHGQEEEPEPAEEAAPAGTTAMLPISAAGAGSTTRANSGLSCEHQFNTVSTKQ